jgi:hypothetical protein
VSGDGDLRALAGALDVATLADTRASLSAALEDQVKKVATGAGAVTAKVKEDPSVPVFGSKKKQPAGLLRSVAGQPQRIAAPRNKPEDLPR